MKRVSSRRRVKRMKVNNDNKRVIIDVVNKIVVNKFFSE